MESMSEDEVRIDPGEEKNGDSISKQEDIESLPKDVDVESEPRGEGIRSIEKEREKESLPKKEENRNLPKEEQNNKATAKDEEEENSSDEDYEDMTTSEDETEKEALLKHPNMASLQKKRKLMKFRESIFNEDDMENMNAEEKLVFCEKVDQSLVKFVEKLEVKRYDAGWTIDKWQDEIFKNTYLRKERRFDNILSTMIAGLRRHNMKWGGRTAEQVALKCKEEGNYNYKHKHYRLAILNYTAGIKLQCEDANLIATLHNNRAAAQFHLEYYESALFDSEKALGHNPYYIKAFICAIKSAHEGKFYDICLYYCQSLLRIDPYNKDGIQYSVLSRQNMPNRKTRKILSKCEDAKTILLMQKLFRNGIRITDNIPRNESHLWRNVSIGPDVYVHKLTGEKRRAVVFYFPEVGVTDYVRACYENQSLMSQMAELFPQDWDKRNKYRIDTISIYYRNRNGVPHKVDATQTYGVILETCPMVLHNGTPLFVVVPPGPVDESVFGYPIEE